MILLLTTYYLLPTSPDMSWQRVIETARKTGMPIIITDPAGREPMVILPLEQFEAMVSEPVTKTRSVSQPSPLSDLLVSRKQEVDDILAEQMAQQFKNRMENAASSLESMTDLSSPEIPLEEGFYLEPIEDKNQG